MKGKALEKLSLAARSEVMREVAKLAMKRGYTQESLAEAVGRPSSNVSRHFIGDVPQEDTVRQYARVLGVPAEYFLILLSGKFEHPQATEARPDRDGSSSERGWLTFLASEFDTSEWTPGTAAYVCGQMRRLAKPERRRHLAVGVLAFYRAQHFDEPVHPRYAARDAFEESVVNAFALAERKRAKIANEDRFLNLWALLCEVLTPAEFDFMLAGVRAKQTKLGIDSAPMDAALQADIQYCSWRQGDRDVAPLRAFELPEIPPGRASKKPWVLDLPSTAVSADALDRDIQAIPNLVRARSRS